MAGSFAPSGAQLAGVAQQQNCLAAAVATGELWLEASVAERAAARCEQAVEDITVSHRSDASRSLTVSPGEAQRLGDAVQRLLAALQPS